MTINGMNVEQKNGRSYEGSLILQEGHRYQIHGGSKSINLEDIMKGLNGEVDYIPEGPFSGQQLLSNIPVEIVAAEIWPRIRKEEDSNRLIEVKNMLKMRLVSKFWLAFVDMSEFMHEQHIYLLNKRGWDSFLAAPGRLGRLARQYSE
jgi:hypothetical protein